MKVDKRKEKKSNTNNKIIKNIYFTINKKNKKKKQIPLQK
jgi:hypothetical protein